MPPKRKAAKSTPARAPTQGDEFPFAAHLFGFPAADGHKSPQAEPPGPWLDEFAANHADREVYLGLFTSCRSGRAWSVRNAKNFIVRLTLDAETPVNEVKQQLTAVQQALALREGKPCQLLIVCSAQWLTSSTRTLELLPRYLRGAGASVSHLLLNSPIGSDNQQAMEAFTEFLRTAAPLLPNLTKLYLPCCPVVLPPPKKLPRLTELAFLTSAVNDSAREALLASASLYLPQLTVLEVDVAMPHTEDYNPEMLYTPWNLLLKANSAHQTLTAFRGSAVLDETLLGLLLDHCPALKELKVRLIDLGSDEYASRQWGITDLCVSDLGEEAHMLAYLPKSTAEGRVRVMVGRKIALEAPLPEDLVARLGEWEFDTGMINITCGPPEPSLVPQVSHTHDTLVTLLSQLSDMRVKDGVVMLLDWEWTHDMAQAVASALQDLPHLSVGVLNDTLTDELLGTVLAMGPHLRDFGVHTVEVESDAHSGAQWPWVKFAVSEEFDATLLFKLPHPSTFTGDTTPAVRCNLVLEADLTQADADSIKAWLQHVKCLGPEHHVHHAPRCPQDTLARQLSVLHSISFHEPSVNERSLINLDEWPLDKATLDTLSQGLPRWQGTLYMADCKWPLKASEYKRLATVIPTSYTAWVLPYNIAKTRLDAVCAGVNERRAGLGLPRLQLVVTSCVEDTPVGDHVIVTDKMPGDESEGESEGGSEDEGESGSESESGSADLGESD